MFNTIISERLTYLVSQVRQKRSLLTSLGPGCERNVARREPGSMLGPRNHTRFQHSTSLVQPPTSNQTGPWLLSEPGSVHPVACPVGYGQVPRRTRMPLGLWILECEQW